MARCFRAGGKAKGASPRRSDKQFLRFHDDASASAGPGLGAEAGKVLQRIADRLSAVSPVPLSGFALPENPFAARALALRLSPDDSPRKRPESPQQPSSKASSMAHFSSEGGISLTCLYGLVRILYESLGGARDGSSETGSARTKPGTSPAPALGVATALEIEEGAACRFCFEGGTDSPLVAPCSCSGTLRWVHEDCLRKWQKTSPFTASACNVCMTTFALAPPKPRQVRAGMLLVAEPSLHGTFSQAVILLCEITPDGAHGIVVNCPSEVMQSTSLAVAYEVSRLRQSGGSGPGSPASPLMIEWRRGGPVCGGRLGVVRYTLMHTLGSRFGSIEVLGAEEVAAGTGESVVARWRGADGAAETESSYGFRSPAALGTNHAARLINSLSAVATIEHAAARAGAVPPVALLFVGHCRWGRGQLQAELARGSWRLCEGRVADVLGDNVQLWQELQRSGRLRTWAEWAFEGAA
ncbi:hypothetical protein EMIHUDRAFT_196406 [Emiliania huxleyi CCMP1516]|uniref:RING-CH-type domain-containing protein n=3 Tax=Emiliania huxleyi TaxID=2903 RepID=A0A0D3J419_EMIH1|nr:hypothetical protein EMIHUDRAFT_196406 [Emiliania huxleyi CCMP1516]EOD18254.1 hypothetical protein EMIHUDRAFT_196406 [Emiliania huxleyi CCMP1516]|eukprot:XP_005770683.1 hypothetical protein EMIHUDRAFT_196406 [Emiliania huxleyi CCMP1516]